MDFIHGILGTGGHYIIMLPPDWSISTSHDPLPSSEKMLWNPSICAYQHISGVLHVHSTYHWWQVWPKIMIHDANTYGDLVLWHSNWYPDNPLLIRFIMYCGEKICSVEGLQCMLNCFMPSSLPTILLSLCTSCYIFNTCEISFPCLRHF